MCPCQHVLGRVGGWGINPKRTNSLCKERMSKAVYLLCLFGPEIDKVNSPAWRLHGENGEIEGEALEKPTNG